MDRIQQRITGFTTTLALFGVFIGLFGYISLLNIEDTENTVNQLGAEAKQTLSNLDENIKKVMKDGRPFSPLELYLAGLVPSEKIFRKTLMVSLKKR